MQSVNTATEWSQEFNRTRDGRWMWQGIQTVTDYKPKSFPLSAVGAALPDEVNLFYAHFDSANNATSTQLHPLTADNSFTISVEVVKRIFNGVNIYKAVGPDGISGHVVSNWLLSFRTYLTCQSGA